MKDITIKRIYRAGATFGAVYINAEGKICSSFFRRNQLMALFVRQNFPARKKYKQTFRVYLQDHLGKKGGLHTVGYLDLKNDVYHMYRAHDAAQEMVDTFGLGHVTA